MAGRTLKQTKGRTPSGVARSREYLQAKKVLPELVRVYDPELGQCMVSRPPSLIERLVLRLQGKVPEPPVVKRGRGRPRKVVPGGGS